MRLVKRSVNQDDPGTYHLFYADADGHPGTDLTFFPFRFSAPGHLGVGLGVEIALGDSEGQPGLLAGTPRRSGRERHGRRKIVAAIGRSS